MTALLHRTGRWAALHPWRAVTGWVLLTACLLGLAAASGGATREDWNVPDAEAQAGLDLLRAHVPGMGDANARVVVHDDAGRLDRRAPALTTLRDRLAELPHVAAVAPPRLSADRDTALLEVRYDVEVTHPDLYGTMAPLEEAVAPTRSAGLQVELNGMVPENAAAPMKGYGELAGVLAALAVLVLAFGSVVAAGLPVGVALAGLAAGSGGLTLLAAVMDVSTAAPTVATMVGLGVGIDYALLILTRHIEHLRAGAPVVEAAALATATAGRAVVVAALTVLVSLLGLRLADLPTYSAFGFACAIAVLCVLGAALLLVPALCRLAGRRLLPRRARRERSAGRRAPGQPHPLPLTARWASRVGGRPLPWALAAAAVMVVLAVPALDMRTWPQDSGSASTELTTRRAFDLVAAEYGPGANGTLTVVAPASDVDVAAMARVRERLAADPGVVRVGRPSASPDGAVVVLDVQPRYAATDARTPALVERLRAELPGGAILTGEVPLFADIAALLARRLPVVIGFVVGVSVLLLAMVFRSVVVPVKAAVMNLLSIGAAYGVLTVVFQWGWGVRLLGLDHAVPVSSWVPILIFAILFGLSMDYEVFLLSRIRERWLDSGDPQGSVVRGLADTGRVITSAAAIMVAVFLGFATETEVVVKMLGLGMAVAVLLDATVVRMVLVPATMALLGSRNWWLPAWADRLLPRLALEPPAYAVTSRSSDDDPDGTRPLVGV